MHSSYLLKFIHKSFLASLIIILLVNGKQLNAAPDILVTIKPIHSLVAGLTQGISQPELLIHGYQSPHDFNLKPSQRRLLATKDFVIYTGPGVESFISGLEDANYTDRFINLSAIPGLKILEARVMHDHGHGHDHHDADSHIWLSIENVSQIVNFLARRFSEADPENGPAYENNRQSLVEQLKILDQYIRQQLAPVQSRPFIIFHDAYQYFEKEFGLQQAFFITSTPEHKPGIRQIRQLRKIIKQQNIRCVFFEPPQKPKIIETITEDASTQVLPLDPLGAEIPAGINQYFQLLKTTTDSISNCLRTTQ